MPQQQRKETRRKQAPESLPFTTRNYQILGLGVAVILIGYWALSQGPWDGTLPLIVAPILLVAGYCFLVPFGILYRKKEDAPKKADESEAPAQA